MEKDGYMVGLEGLAGLVQRSSRLGIQYMYLKAASQAMFIACGSLCCMSGRWDQCIQLQCPTSLQRQLDYSLVWSARCLWHGPPCCSSCHEHNLDDTTI